MINLRKFWATNCCTYFFVAAHPRAFKANYNYKSKEPTLEDIILSKSIIELISSVTQSCPTLCYPMNRSTAGLPVHHQLPEFTQIHVHGVSDAIQPSHPLSSPSPPASNASQHQSLSNESTLRMRWPEYWSFSVSISPSSEHPALISFRMDWY